MNVRLPNSINAGTTVADQSAAAPKLPETTAEKFIPVALVDIHPAAMRPEPSDPEAAAIERLALEVSIRENGLLQPVLCRPVDGGRFQVIDGSRRFAATVASGRQSIRATVRPMNDSEALELAGVGNLLRRDWDPMQRAVYLKRLCTPSNKAGAGMSLEEVARRFGHSVSWVKNTIRLGKLPEPWRSQLIQGAIAETTARILIPHLDKPAVLKAIELHQSQHPNRWRLREDWKKNIDFVLERLEELHAAIEDEQGEATLEKTQALGRETKAAEPKDWVDERIDRQADDLIDTLTSHHETIDSFDAAPDGPLTPETAKRFLEPFFHDRDDLLLISAIASQRAMELKN